MNGQYYLYGRAYDYRGRVLEVKEIDFSGDLPAVVQEIKRLFAVGTNPGSPFDPSWSAQLWITDSHPAGEPATMMLRFDRFLQSFWSDPLHRRPSIQLRKDFLAIYRGDC